MSERAVHGWRRWLGLALAILAVLLIVLTLLPLWQTDEWWVRLWDYPRLQLAVMIILVGAGFAALMRPLGRMGWGLLAALGAALAWQAVHFVHYLPLWPKQVASVANCPPARTLKLLNANVLMTNREYAATLAMVRERDADVVLFLEPGPDWGKQIRSLYPDYPWRIGEAAPNTYGMIMLSRLPMDARIRHRMQPGVPSIDAEVTLRDGSKVTIKALHPEPPFPGDDSGERDVELVQAGREVRASGRAALVLGDLNDVAWSATSKLFRDVGGMLDPRVGRGLYPTFHAGYPLLRWPLDHMFVTPHWRIMGIDRLAGNGSDHFAIAYKVCLAQPADKRLVSARADEVTRDEAREQVSDGREEKKREDLGQE